MANTPKNLYRNQPGTAYSTLYTVPASTTTLVKSLVLHNTTATDATVTLNFIASGGTVGLTNQLIDYTVTAKDTVTIAEDGVFEVLNEGSTIQGKQGTSAAITVSINGVEVS
jgi:hypothetical protein